MKVFYCDICGERMPEERHMLIPITRFDMGEQFNIKCFDDCGYSQADICKDCENKIKDAIHSVISKRRPE